MKFLYLETVGFRKFKNKFQCDFYDTTHISAGNAKGKTNILYAIVWTLLGTNLTGDERACLIHNKCDECYCKLEFLDNNNVKHSITRYKHRVYNSKNFITLDRNKIEQKDLVNFYHDKKLFLSIFNLSYYIDKSPAEKKELIEKYLPSIDIKEVFNKLDKKEQKLLEGVPENITEYIKDINASIKIAEKNITSLNGKIEYAENITSQPVEKQKEFLKEEELGLAEQELDNLKRDTELIDKAKQQENVEKLQNQELDYENDIAKLDKEMKSGKQIYLNMKNQEQCICPTCGQNLHDTSRNIAITNFREQLLDLYNKKTAIETKLSDIKSKIMIEKMKLYSFSGETNINKERHIKQIEQDIKNLQNEKQEIITQNNIIKTKQETINKAIEDIKNFTSKIEENKKLIENLKETYKVANKLYINIIEEKMQNVTKYLKDVKIKFYTVLKETGELKEDFIITYKGNSLNNLSRSEKIATSLEIANMLNNISKLNSPFFIDDAESCPDFNFIQDYSKNTQILISEVKKHKSLTIANYNNKSEFTKYKLQIKGCKTLNIPKNNIERQAA